MANGDELLGSEIDVVFNINGQDVVVRVDHLVETADGVVVYVEAKFTSGGSPGFTPNQQIVIPELIAAGDDGLRGIVARSGDAPGLSDGEILQVVVQVDVWAGGPTLVGDP